MRIILCMVLGAVAACGDDDETDTAGDDTVDTDTDTEDDCDPVGADPEFGALLNAPVEADVEVIDKVPQHPGEPGPENLP